MNKLRAGAPITVGRVAVIPIERVRIDSEKLADGYWLNVALEAVAVVICEGGNPRALDVEARERRVDEFLTKIPELEPLLQEFLPP